MQVQLMQNAKKVRDLEIRLARDTEKLATAAKTLELALAANAACSERIEETQERLDEARKEQCRVSTGLLPAQPHEQLWKQLGIEGLIPTDARTQSLLKSFHENLKALQSHVARAQKPQEGAAEQPLHKPPPAENEVMAEEPKAQPARGHDVGDFDAAYFAVDEQQNSNGQPRRARSAEGARARSRSDKRARG